ncbi:MAG TPA: hypothetical protein VJ203_12325 [Bacteroidales bacterium]|nr:hypothetical protein [Bacteroidales bacterium]
MKNNICYLCIFFLALLALSCEKQQEKTPDTLNLSGFKSGNTSELVNVRLKSGKITSSPVECYLLGSTLFDPTTGGYGYVDCHGKFYLIDPLTGDTLKAIAVPEFLSQAVIDTVENMLIGKCYEAGSNYVYKINLETGEIAARNEVDLGTGTLACTFFYKTPEKEYILMRADSTLVFINPDTGVIVDSAKAFAAPANGYYDAANDRLIGVTYDVVTDRNYLVTLDATTGELVYQVQIQERNDYFACMSGYDAETSCYILLNPDNVVLFIDIETGETKDSYDIGFRVEEFKFWRERDSE